jgi:mono/diheme cytochrome c family protein
VRSNHAAVCALLLAVLTTPLAGWGERAGDALRGRSVFETAGGCTCHTDYDREGESAAWLAGGRALSTPFGTYYSTNITPDPTTGIGRFSEVDFLRAMQQGVAPDGSNYFPVFPYTSFTHMSDADLRDLFAYLARIPPIARANRAPDVAAPFRWRFAVTPWKWLNFEAGRFVPDAAQSAAWNRGAYLLNGPAHCAECHTPRTLSGGTDRTLWLAGSNEGAEGKPAPNLTPDGETGIGDWSIADLDWYLETGFKPDGDDTQGLMAELIEHGFSHLPKSDRRAIATYLHSLAPIRHEVRIEN